MPSDREIRLLVADDHEVIRQGVKGLVADTEIKIVAEAACGRCAVRLAVEQDLDAALLAVRMRSGGGLAALKRIKVERPSLPVLMFSVFDDPAAVAKALALGANGFLLKVCGREELLRAIRAVAAGGSVWTDEQLCSMSGARGTARTRGGSEVLLLSAREACDNQVWG